MKFISLFAALLLTVAVASASFPYPCGPNNCQSGYICHTLNNQCQCIAIPDCHDVSLQIKQIGQWVDGSRGGKTYTQYDVTIVNSQNTNIKQIIVDTDYTLRLRDGNALWNMVKLSNGDLVLPSYQPSINAHASYTFGFIIEGTQQPHLAIKAVTY